MTGTRLPSPDRLSHWQVATARWASFRSRYNLMARMGHDNERAALIYQHKSSPADRQIADGLDALLRASRERRTDDDGTTGALAPVS